MSPLKGLLQKPYSSAYPLSFKNGSVFMSVKAGYREKGHYEGEKGCRQVQIRVVKRRRCRLHKKITYAAKNIDRREKGSVKPMKGTKKPASAFRVLHKTDRFIKYRISSSEIPSRIIGDGKNLPIIRPIYLSAPNSNGCQKIVSNHASNHLLLVGNQFQKITSSK